MNPGQSTIDLETITDIKELKALKSDQYDSIEMNKQSIEQSIQNLQAINTRIAQLEESAEKTGEKSDK